MRTVSRAIAVCLLSLAAVALAAVFGSMGTSRRVALVYTRGVNADETVVWIA